MPDGQGDRLPMFGNQETWCIESVNTIDPLEIIKRKK